METVLILLTGIFATIIAGIFAVIYYIVKSNEQRDLNYRAAIKAGILPGGYNAPTGSYSEEPEGDEEKILKFLQSDTFMALTKMMPKQDAAVEPKLEAK